MRNVKSLDLIIHSEKSILVPTRFIKYLGFVLDAADMKISLSNVKKEKAKLQCSEILKDESR